MTSVDTTATDKPKFHKKKSDWENIVRLVCGNYWKNLTGDDLNAAYGIAIIKAILNGAKPSVAGVSAYLKISQYDLEVPFHNLALNGIFINNKIEDDRQALESGDVHVWGYYGGYAANATRYWWEF